MLTSLFYYEHYRPYILNSAGASGKKAEPPRKARSFSEKTDEAPTEVALIKTLNKDVINYAKGIYRNTTDLKYASKKLSSSIKNYSKYKDHEEFDQDTFERGFNDDLERFAGSYNKSVKFLKSQQHSAHLVEAADVLEQTTDESSKILSVMGVNKNEDGDLTVNKSENTFFDGVNSANKNKAAEKLFSKINGQTTHILDSPMANHMNFKSLNYYYNYEADNVRVDTFQTIKTGLLVNIAL